MTDNPTGGSPRPRTAFFLGLLLVGLVPVIAAAGAEVDPGWIIIPAAIALLVILCGLLGGIIGVVIVLVNHRKRFKDFSQKALFVIAAAAVGVCAALASSWIALVVHEWLK